MIARAAAADLTSVNRADQGKYVALSFRDGAQRRARNPYSRSAAVYGFRVRGGSLHSDGA